MERERDRVRNGPKNEKQQKVKVGSERDRKTRGRKEANGGSEAGGLDRTQQSGVQKGRAWSEDWTQARQSGRARQRLIMQSGLECVV